MFTWQNINLFTSFNNNFIFNFSLYYLKELKFFKKLIINCSFRLNFSYATITHCLFNELWQLPLKRSVKRRNKMIKLKTKLYIVYFCYFMFHVFICQKLQNWKNLNFFIKVIFLKLLYIKKKSVNIISTSFRIFLNIYFNFLVRK